MKRLLTLKASQDVCIAETQHIKTIADLIGIECDQLVITSLDEVIAGVVGGEQFDYIYLCGHANEHGFGEADGSRMFAWGKFALALCNANWLNTGGILFLATCRGGLRSIADTMFRMCGKIDYICGPRWSVDKHDLTAGFHSFIYNLEIRNEEPAVAVERASSATGRHFFCYDRLECCSAGLGLDSALSTLQSLVSLGVLNEQQVLGSLFGGMLKDETTGA
ncbi:MAG: hypothetical protein WAL87_00470 [Chthoniobacterales bacterium]